MEILKTMFQKPSLFIVLIPSILHLSVKLAYTTHSASVINSKVRKCVNFCVFFLLFFFIDFQNKALVLVTFDCILFYVPRKKRNSVIQQKNTNQIDNSWKDYFLLIARTNGDG